nr:anthranilate synthase component I family protein [Candidatus Sigynarchaeota archaeon]
MELNLNIKKLGYTDDIFAFYRFMSRDQESKNHVLLESVAEESHKLMFSFVCLKPDFMVKVIGDKLEIYDVATEIGEVFKRNSGEHEQKLEEQGKLPFDDDVPLNMLVIDKLKEIFPITRNALPELFPRKIFSGGLLGYIGYDVVAPYVGYKPSDASRDMFPDAVMGFFTNVIAYSHATHAVYLITNSIGSHSDLDIGNMFSRFKQDSRPTTKVTPAKADFAEILKQETNFKSNTSMDQWRNIIDQTREHIQAGDIIQAVISRKAVAVEDVKPLDVYRALRILNPSPYMFFCNFHGAHNGDIHLIGSSPEALITKDQTNLHTVPIAGTRRRGRTPEDEERMAQELLHSEKEIAEHIMLVDLARNDLSRVSQPGSVDTYELISLKKFPNVMHLTSKIRTVSYLDPFTILKAMFPAGTVSGAPKKRAMEIINRLEVENRGPYAGSFGYISFAGDMDMAISIRTIFNKNRKYIAQAGAGIVADSKPDEEYLETENKMKGILSTINLALHMEGAP